MDKHRKIGKELYYDLNKNQYYIFNENEKIKCGVYGVPLPTFKLDSTGFKKEKTQVKEKLNYITENFDKTLYRPTTKCFDGYFAFPRPLEKMFNNTNFYDKSSLSNQDKSKQQINENSQYPESIMKMRSLIKARYKNVVPSNYYIKEKREIIPFLDNRIFKSELNKIDKAKVIKLLANKVEENNSRVQGISLEERFENNALKKNIDKIKHDGKFKLFNVRLKEPLKFLKTRFEEVDKFMKSDDSKRKTQYIEEFQKKPNNKLIKQSEDLFSHTYSDFITTKKKDCLLQNLGKLWVFI